MMGWGAHEIFFIWTRLGKRTFCAHFGSGWVGELMELYPGMNMKYTIILQNKLSQDSKILRKDERDISMSHL